MTHDEQQKLDALLKAARETCVEWLYLGGNVSKLDQAVRAFDPPPEPVYTMPAWEELSLKQQKSIRSECPMTWGSDGVRIHFETIRQITAKVPS